MSGLYGFWIWLKEILGFGNLGTIHIIGMKWEKKEQDDEQMETIQSKSTWK